MGKVRCTVFDARIIDSIPRVKYIEPIENVNPHIAALLETEGVDKVVVLANDRLTITEWTKVDW